MKKVAPELESLMWTLAEEGNDRAIDEFGERHPALRPELLKRIEMVKGLRGAKKKPVEQPKPIPRFVPREVKPVSLGYVTGGLVLAAICAAAFLISLYTIPKSSPPVAPIQPPQQPIVNNEPKVPQAPPSSPVPGIVVPPQYQVNSPESEKPPTLGTLKIEHAPLFTVLQMISQICQVDVQPAPGLANPDVVVDYRDLTAVEMLRDLGKQYGFTPMDQHDGSIIVVPVVDPRDMPLGGDSKGALSDRKLGG